MPVPGFPFTIGRSAQASLQLVAPGVFEDHLRLELDPDDGVVVQVGAGALATVGGESFQRRRLRQGEEVSIGAFELRLLLSPPARRSLRFWEIILWLMLAGVVIVELILLQGLFR